MSNEEQMLPPEHFVSLKNIGQIVDKAKEKFAARNGIAVGSTEKPVYVESDGTITECSGNLKVGSSGIGSSSEPVYVDANGKLQKCTATRIYSHLSGYAPSVVGEIWIE